MVRIWWKSYRTKLQHWAFGTTIVAGKILWTELCFPHGEWGDQNLGLFWKVISFRLIWNRFSPERLCWELSCLVAWNGIFHLWNYYFICGRVTSFVDTSRVFCRTALGFVTGKVFIWLVETENASSRLEEQYFAPGRGNRGSNGA